MTPATCRPIPARRYVVFLVAPLVACTGRTDQEARLSEVDRHAIRAVDSAYVDAWLRDDTTAVMATLTRDAVLLPAGLHQLVGQDAIRSYWWPQDGSHTIILTFVSNIDEVGGGPDLAYLRGTDSLTFRYAKDTVQLTRSTRTMTLSLLVREGDGRWRMARKMWGPLTP